MSTLVYFGSMQVGLPNGPGVNEYDFLGDVSAQESFATVVAYCPMTDTAYEKLSIKMKIIKTTRFPVLRELDGGIKFCIDLLSKRVMPSVVIIRLGQLPIIYWFLVLLLQKLKVAVHVKTVGVGTAKRGKGLSIIRTVSFIITKKVLQNCTSLDTPTEYAKSQIVDVFGVHSEKVIVVSNGSPIFEVPKKAVEKSGTVTLGYVGRFPFVRGGKQVIQALSQCRASGISVNAIITGTPEEVLPLKELALRLKVDDFIDFVGLVDKEEIPGILTKIDFGFSIVEGIRGTSGQKLRQYLMAGCSVIYKNDEFFELIDENFIHHYETDLDACQFILNALAPSNRVSRADIREWAKDNISYSMMNEVRMQHLMRLALSRGN